MLLSLQDAARVPSSTGGGVIGCNSSPELIRLSLSCHHPVWVIGIIWVICFPGWRWCIESAIILAGCCKKRPSIDGGDFVIKANNRGAYLWVTARPIACVVARLLIFKISYLFDRNI